MLTLAYIALCVIGCGYILVTALLGQFGDVADAGHAGDAVADYGVDGGGHGAAHAGDAAHASFHFPIYSPLAMSTLFASIGAWGLIARYGLDVSDGVSLAIALPAALVTAWGVAYGSFRVLRSSRGTSTIRNAEIVGSPAEVITPIPEGGVGEVAVLLAGQRFTSPAREAQGAAVARGAVVKVTQTVGPTLIVSAAGPIQGDE